MYFESQLVDSSRIIADMVIDSIGNDKKRFKDLLDICYRDEYPLSMRASRVSHLIILKKPEMIKPYIQEFVWQLFKINDISNLKNFLAIVWNMNPKLDDKKLGILVDKCFSWLADEQSTPAVKIYSMEILYNVSFELPDISQELISTIEDQIPFGSIGFKNRAAKVLKRIMNS